MGGGRREVFSDPLGMLPIYITSSWPYPDLGQPPFELF